MLEVKTCHVSSGPRPAKSCHPSAAIRDDSVTIVVRKIIGWYTCDEIPLLNRHLPMLQLYPFSPNPSKIQIHLFFGCKQYITMVFTVFAQNFFTSFPEKQGRTPSINQPRAADVVVAPLPSLSGRSSVFPARTWRRASFPRDPPIPSGAALRPLGRECHGNVIDWMSPKNDGFFSSILEWKIPLKIMKIWMVFGRNPSFDVGSESHWSDCELTFSLVWDVSPSVKCSVYIVISIADFRGSLLTYSFPIPSGFCMICDYHYKWGLSLCLSEVWFWCLWTLHCTQTWFKAMFGKSFGLMKHDETCKC